LAKRKHRDGGSFNMSELNSKSPEPSLPPNETVITKLKVLYFAALCLIAAVIITSSLLLQHAISESAGDSRVINLAGRQRMLSQRLAKDVLALKIACPAINCTDRIEEMRLSLNDWTRAHEGLQHGDASLQLPQRENSREIRETFSKLDSHHKAMVSAGNTLLGAPNQRPTQQQLDQAIKVILDHEPEFLRLMDRITFQFDKESKSNLQSINEIEGYILILGLLLLLLEFLLVFRPSLRNLGNLFRALVRRTDELAESNLKLRLQLEESARLRAEADSANRAKSAFLSNISHEIRTPLNSIIGFTEILERKLLDTPSAEYLAPLRNAGFSLLNLVNDVLDLSKIEAGKTEIKLAPVQVHQLLQELKDIFLDKIQQKGLEFRITISKTLPNTLVLDGMRLRQILVNLIGNSIKFTSCGYIQLSVECKEFSNSSKTQKRVELLINLTDSGCGMSSEYQKNLFSPFHQEDNAFTRKLSGTGLGLSIVKNLVELMSGTIGVESEVDQGTSFRISIPDLEVPELPDSLKIAKAAIDRTLDFTATTILLADANPYDRLYLKSAFEEFANLHIIEVENGGGILKAVQKQPIDLIITELRLPEIDGLEVAKKLRADSRFADIALILLTGSVFELEDANNARAFGRIFDLRLRKPVQVTEIIASLRMLLPHKLDVTPDASRELIKPTSETFDTLNLDLSTHLPYWQNNIDPVLHKISKSCSSDDVEALLKHIQLFNNMVGAGLLNSYLQKLQKAFDEFDLSEIIKLAEVLIAYKQTLFKCRP
jgi:signal transduction histidine kinase/CheY-like chemotaxis protein